MIASTEIKRPALRYYGGKWKLAPWIVSYFPPHNNYVEPCGGAASVLLQKPRSPLETYNDLDGNVVNFFRVLRNQPDELIRKIRLTPWAREEYKLSLQPVDDPVEAARRFYVKKWASIGAGGKGSERNFLSLQHSPKRKRAKPPRVNIAVRIITPSQTARIAGTDKETKCYSPRKSNQI